jgi:hypothetical protein
MVMLRIPLLLGILSAGQAAAGNGEVANPEHQRWAGFKVGSWVQFEQPCGKDALMQETYKLLEFTAEKVVLECTKVENGFKYPLFQQEVAAKLGAGDGAAGAEARKPEGGEIEEPGPGGKVKCTWKKTGEGDEEIELAGKKLKCHWVHVKRSIDSRIEAMKDRSSAKTWYSDEIPGRVAKIEMTRWIQDNPPYEFVVVRAAKAWKRE